MQESRNWLLRLLLWGLACSAVLGQTTTSGRSIYGDQDKKPSYRDAYGFDSNQIAADNNDNNNNNFEGEGANEIGPQDGDRVMHGRYASDGAREMPDTHELGQASEPLRDLALADRYAQFGGLPDSTFGMPYKFNPFSFSGLSGLNSDLSSLLFGQPSQVSEDLEKCPNDVSLGLKYYCLTLDNGLFYDPWNPMCGFIECVEGVARRVACSQGTWLGFDPDANQKMLCRKPMRLKIDGDKCPNLTLQKMCKMAETVTHDNPSNIYQSIDFNHQVPPPAAQQRAPTRAADPITVTVTPEAETTTATDNGSP